MVSYLLQGKGVKLELQNHAVTGRTNRIGGSVTGEYGIICNVTLESHEVDPSMVKAVLEALHDTYIPPPPPITEEQKMELDDWTKQIEESKQRQNS